MPFRVPCDRLAARRQAGRLSLNTTAIRAGLNNGQVGTPCTSDRSCKAGRSSSWGIHWPLFSACSRDTKLEATVSNWYPWQIVLVRTDRLSITALQSSRSRTPTISVYPAGGWWGVTKHGLSIRQCCDSNPDRVQSHHVTRFFPRSRGSVCGIR